jgi:hypothetical protein
MTHSFFAIMGGFVVDHSLHSNERASLTGKAILHTARTENTLPDIPRRSIEDRSKSDGLGKMLICIQAGYTILQVFGRLKSGLAVTLLEINTLGHVFCALMLYIFWFSKPLDVKEPMVLTPRWAQPLDAIWSMRNRTFQLCRTRDRRQQQVKEREVFDHFRYETLQRIRRSIQRSSDAKSGFSARVVNNNLSPGCASCGYNRSDQQATRHESSSTLTFESWVCRLCGLRNYPEGARNLQSIQRCRICWKRKRPYDTSWAEQAANISPEPFTHWPSNGSLEYSESDTAINPVAISTMEIPETACLLDRNVSPVHGLHDLRNIASSDNSHEERDHIVNTEPPSPMARSLSFEDASKSAATLRGANSFGSLKPTQVPIFRQLPSKYEIGTWETTELALVWHDFDNSLDDDAVRHELGDCLLWSCVSRIYCVDRGLRDECYFRSAPATFSEMLNDYAVVNTAATDRICGVQLDLPGLRRWNAAYEVACDSLYTKDTFEEAALKKIEIGTTTLAGDGLNVYNALQYWEEDKDKNQFLRHGIPNWPSGAGYLKPPRKWIPKVTFALVTACYGALHAAAWHFSFPSRHEQILWRMSALTVASTCFFVFACFVFFFAHNWLEDNFIGYLYLLWIVGGGLAIVYCVARFFLVLEAFISLRKVPPSAYDTLRWTTLLPHL